jgi:hypothetical protein
MMKRARSLAMSSTNFSLLVIALTVSVLYFALSTRIAGRIAALFSEDAPPPESMRAPVSIG